MNNFEYRAIREPGGSNRFKIQRRTFLGWGTVATEYGQEAAQKYLDDLIAPQILTPSKPSRESAK